MGRGDRPDLRHALETAASYQPITGSGGAPVVTWNVAPMSTFRDRAGRYCREFELEATTGGITRGALGVACRGPEGAWGVELLVARSAPGESDAGGDEYAPAESAGTDAYGALVEALISGELLSTETEAALIGRGWR